MSRENSKTYFSVVIPTYNRAGIITETINSVIQQDFPDFEIIVIDDGSKDDTEQTVSKIHDNRIFYFKQENKERSAARNHGIRKSSGKYICFLDSDDRYEKNHLSTLYEFIKSTDEKKALFFTNHYILQNKLKKEVDLPVLNPNDAVNYFLYNPVIPARVCIHHEILQTHTFDERIVIVEDTVLWIHIALHYPVYHINKSSVLYHLHDDNSVHISYNAFATRLHGLKLFFNDNEIRNAIPSKTRKQILSDCYFGIARHFEYKKLFFKMLYYLLLSFVYSPVHVQNKSKLFMIYKFIFKSKNHA